VTYTEKPSDPLYDALLPIIEGAGLSLIEWTLSRHKGAVQARLVIFRPGGVGVSDCQSAHRAAQARLEAAFPESDIYIEVSSTGINRVIKDAAEFRHYIGLTTRCYLPAEAEWLSGIVLSADSESLTLDTPDGDKKLCYDEIAKARLDN
jgi:ribosome maturation factor RimP